MKFGLREVPSLRLVCIRSLAVRCCGNTDGVARRGCAKKSASCCQIAFPLSRKQQSLPEDSKPMSLQELFMSSTMNRFRLWRCKHHAVHPHSHRVSAVGGRVLFVFQPPIPPAKTVHSSSRSNLTSGRCTRLSPTLDPLLVGVAAHEGWFGARAPSLKRKRQ